MSSHAWPIIPEVLTADASAIDRSSGLLLRAVRKTIREERPAFDDGSEVTSVITIHHYNSKGQLEHTEHRYNDDTQYLADTWYVYDEFGQQIASGEDLGGDPGLEPGGNDRYTEVDDELSGYFFTSNAWWYVAASKTYAANDSGTATPLGKQKRKLSGFGTWQATGDNQTEETTSVDLYDNETRSWTTINRASKEVTRSTDHPDSSTDETAVTCNGLLQSSTSKTGVTTGYAYDALGRLTATTDPRTGPTTMGYYSQTDAELGKLKGQLEYVRDPESRQTTHTYDTTTGRLASVTRTLDSQPPVDVVERLAHTSRGEQEYVWGNGTYPVAYEYDDYGRWTKMHLLSPDRDPQRRSQEPGRPDHSRRERD